MASLVNMSHVKQQESNIRMISGTTQMLARVGEVRMPSNVSAGEVKTLIMMSLNEIVGVDGACSSIVSSDMWGCAPVHSKLVYKIVFSNR